MCDTCVVRFHILTLMETSNNILNTTINLQKDRFIAISLTPESDLLFVFNVIKDLVNWTEYIPLSIYSVSRKTKGVVHKKKISISFFRHSSVFELLDYAVSTESNILSNSGDTEYSKIMEWELRYSVSIPIECFDMKVKNILKVYGSNNNFCILHTKND